MQTRGLKFQEAAAYCGVAESTLRSWMSKGLVPKPWPQTHRVDRLALDKALDRLSQMENQSDDDAAFDQWEQFLDGGAT